MEYNLANSIILPAKNGGLKAWSHSVRKANFRRGPLTTIELNRNSTAAFSDLVKLVSADTLPLDGHQ